MKADHEKYLTKIYTDPSHSASFSGPSKLKQVVDREGKYKISRNEINAFLETQDSYTSNRHVRRKFRRGHIVTRGIKDQYELDLIDMGRLSKYNDNVKFLLTAVDSFTRVAMVTPLKDKKADTVLGALKPMLSGENKCRIVRSDFGAEFKNAKLKAFLDSNNIKQFFAHPPLKAQIVECFNQSLKQLIYRYLHHTNKYRYIDQLDAIITSYNHRPHRSLGTLSPHEVSKKNEVSLWNQMYVNRPYASKAESTRRNTNIGKKRKSLKPTAKFKLKEGDLVRVSYNRRAFERSFLQRFSEEVFRIRRRILRDNIPTYLLADLNGSVIKGLFYGPELQRVSQDDDKLFKVDKILKYRGKGVNREVLVSWLGYGPAFNQWVPYSSIKTI